MNDSRDVWQLVDAKQKPLIELSDRIWSMPELCYAETRSSAEHLAELERHGFRVTSISQAGACPPVTSMLRPAQ